VARGGSVFGWVEIPGLGSFFLIFFSSFSRVFIISVDLFRFAHPDFTSIFRPFRFNLWRWRRKKERRGYAVGVFYARTLLTPIPSLRSSRR